MVRCEGGENGENGEGWGPRVFFRENGGGSSNVLLREGRRGMFG